MVGVVVRAGAVGAAEEWAVVVDGAVVKAFVIVARELDEMARAHGTTDYHSGATEVLSAGDWW